MPTATNQFTLPVILGAGREDEAAKHVERYFEKHDASSGAGFTGAFFDGWDSTGGRFEDLDRFTADDLLAVTFLSVQVSPLAAEALLGSRREEFSGLLHAIEDRDLADVAEPLTPESPEWRFSDALRSLPDVGPTVASKLMARKRPRLLPIFDSVINDHVLGGSGVLWEPLRAALRADQQALSRRLLDIRSRSGVGDGVSAIRVFDVLAWMEGKGHP